MTWRERGLAAGVSLGLAAFGFAGGWVSHRPAPAHVEEHTGQASAVQEHVAVQEQRQEARTAASDVRERVVTRTVYLRRPDGTVTRETTSERGSEARAVSTQSATDMKVGYHDRVVTQVQWRDRVEDAPRALPAWRLTVTGGLQRPTLAPTWRDAVIGVQLDRRVLGPVSAGAWARTDGSFGLALGVSW